MNRYQIQAENKKGGWDWICVYSDTDTDAILKANFEIANNEKWKDYYVGSILSVEKDVIISPLNTEENLSMAYFKVNWGDYTKELSKMAMTENWSNPTYPDNGVLKNYLTHTYNKVKSDKSVIQKTEYGLFNTGLFTRYYEPIYAYATAQNPVTFLTSYELGNLGIEEYPERANYFEQPELLLFDWHYKINVQYKHILEDKENKERIPEDILNSGNIVTILNGAIDTMKKKVSSNYKIAIPQYFGGQIQLLLPLCLRSDDKPDLALVVTKTGKYYQGHTCITLDMAYNNARLIAKPENNWLDC
jgi:hypothetical protein